MDVADTSVNLKAISELVRSFSGQGSARPSDDSPLPRGPWDPIVRTAMASARASSAEARLAFLATITGNAALWELVGGWGSRLAAVALNPQPLPPLESALNPEPLPPRHQVLTAMAEAVIDRAELLGTVASGQEEQRGIIIVSGYVDKLADDFCGTGFKLPFPGHGPRPPWWGARRA